MGCTATSCTGCKGACHECKKCVKPPRASRMSTDSRTLEEEVVVRYLLGLKGRVKIEVESNDDFLSHHLQNEHSLTAYGSSYKIRARQIIEHYMFSDINHAKYTGTLSTSKLTEFALKAWFQRTFLEVLERGEREYLGNEKGDYNKMREQVAEEYIFEIYQMGEFINAGCGKFSTKDWHLEIPLSLVMLNSDSALYALLGRLQEKYPLVEEVPDLRFPHVESTSSNLNLLSLIKSKCYSDPDHLNRQSLMDDLKVLIDDANDLRPDFDKDMVDMLGPETLTDCKVKRTMRDNKIFYKAEAVRRIFIKWSETLIERIPEVYSLKEFLDFVRSKKRMANEFIFKGTVSQSTHQQVIDSLSDLLEALKYQRGTKTPRAEFGLFIYDFLRCKTTRKTGEEIVQLLDRMKATKLTKSGKRFEVIRVKNRFKWATRDLLINFRYGEHLVGEAQLCVDVSHEDQDLAKRIKFRHYLYELERGLFGPTFEMIMQYEDATRKDIMVNLETEGLISRRIIGPTNSQLVTRADRKCPQNHQMIALKGGAFVQDNISTYIDHLNEDQTKKLSQSQRSDPYVCDFCFSRFLLSEVHHYCYYCSIFYCTKCLKTYKQFDKKKIQLNCMNHDIFEIINSPEDMKKLCTEKRSIIVIFYRNGASSSKLYMDQIAYLASAFKQVGRKLNTIYLVNVGNKSFQNEINQFHIERTPTTIIFNSQLAPQITLVGANCHDIESLLKVRDRIAHNMPKGLKLNCSICHELMISEEGQEKAQGQCQVCMDTNKIEGLQDLVRMLWLEVNDFVCKNNHVRCAYCSYLSNDSPSYYRDFTGRTYLSNKLLLKPGDCFNGHEMESVPQPKDFKCADCRRILNGNTDEEVSYCRECDQYICIDCEEADTETLREKWYRSLLKQIEIVTHFVENRVEEAHPCGCGKYFLKVYQSRKLEGQLKMGAAMSELINEGALSWRCRVCKQEENKLRVHLACFYCAYAQQKKGKPSHTQICIQCAQRSGLIGRKLKQKVFEVLTDFVCSEGHNIFLTSLRDNNQLFYECTFCHNNYYPYSERYECRTCKIKICPDCSDQHLIDKRTYSTNKKCNKGHELAAIRKAPKLEFCSDCNIYLKEAYFKCVQEKCQYYLCLKCGEKTGNLDNKMNKMEQVKQMQQEQQNLGVTELRIQTSQYMQQTK